MAPEPPRRAWWMAKRVLLAAVGIVLLTGGAPEPAPTIYHARKGRRRGILAAGSVAIVGIIVALAAHFLPVTFG